MSRRAVSGEHLAIAAHLLLVSLPSKPSSNRLTSFTCRSFSGAELGAAQSCQNRVLTSTASRVCCAWSTARCSVARNHASHSVTSSNAFWRSEEHTSELQSLMRNSYAVFCLKKKNIKNILI